MMRFSKRTNWEAQPNEWSQRLSLKRSQGEKLWDLTASNPTEVGLVSITADILDAFQQRANLNYEPEPQGLLATRQKIAGYYRERRSATISAEDIFLTPGTSDGYNYLFRLLTDPGDEILCAAPGYPLFDMLADINDIIVKKFSLRWTDGRWCVDWRSLRSSLTDRTKAVLIVHPNNPTGHYWTMEEKRQIEELCSEKGVALIVDEVFWDYAWEPSVSRAQFADDDAAVLKFTVNGISKMLGLPQMKLAWVTLHGPQDLRREASRKLEMIADAFLSTSTPIQHALPRWMEGADAIQTEILERVRSNRDHLARAFDVSWADLYPSEGGWYALLCLSNSLTDEEVCMKALAQKNIILHPGYFFDLSDGEFLVLSLLTKPDIFREGIDRLSVLYK